MTEKRLVEIVPISIKDNKYKAFANIFELSLKDINIPDLTPLLLETSSDEILYILAEQLHILGTEGWMQADTEEKKKNLIRSSVELHKKRGTKWAVQYVMKLLGLKGSITEWWEKEPKGKPYTFELKIHLDHSGFSKIDLIRLCSIVNAHKNARSWYIVFLIQEVFGSFQINSNYSLKTKVSATFNSKVYTSMPKISMSCVIKNVTQLKTQ